MKLLIDTQCWLWWFAQPDRLRQPIVDTIANEDNELWLGASHLLKSDQSIEILTA